MMSHLLTSIQAKNPYQLQGYIDNRDNDKTVGLRCIIFWVGWHNIQGYEFIKVKGKRINIEPGLYNINDLEYIFSNEDIELSANKNNGIASIKVPSGSDIQCSPGIKALLGIANEHLTAGKHTGDKMIDFAKPKELRIYLDQINTSKNFVNGKPSTLLGVAPVPDRSFGKTGFYRFEYPAFKELTSGCITELSVTITDENNNILDNHGLPISIEILIKNQQE